MQQLYLPLKFGRLLITRVANPAVATNFSYGAANALVEELASVSLLLTTDANVANRNTVINILDATGTIQRYAGTQVTAANQAQTWMFAPGLPNLTAIGTNYVHFSPNIIIPRGGSVDSLVNNLQAGDQLSAIIIVTRVWARP